MNQNMNSDPFWEMALWVWKRKNNFPFTFLSSWLRPPLTKKKKKKINRRKKQKFNNMC